MKMNIIKTSDWDYKDTKDFSSLQELLNFIKEVRTPCILTQPDFRNDWEWELEIYDDYRE